MRGLKRQGGWIAHRGGASRRYIALTISANATNYNVFTQAGNPADVVEVVVTINSGVTVTSNVAAALTFPSNFASGSTARLINNGAIKGIGGSGGQGGTGNADNDASAASGDNGTAGGDAISTYVSISIDNTNGEIFGGGGGGGGGAATYTANPIGTFADGGGGGGGQQGLSLDNAGAAGGAGASAGVAGTNASAGVGGAGENGGAVIGGTGGTGAAWGDTGSDGGAASSAGGVGTPGTGGAGGYAVRLNSGATCTFEAGNTAAKVKGAVG